MPLRASYGYYVTVAFTFAIALYSTPPRVTATLIEEGLSTELSPPTEGRIDAVVPYLFFYDDERYLAAPPALECLGKAGWPNTTPPPDDYVCRMGSCQPEGLWMR